MQRWRFNHLWDKPITIEGFVDVNELQEVAHRWKQAFTNMISIFMLVALMRLLPSPSPQAIKVPTCLPRVFLCF